MRSTMVLDGGERGDGNRLRRGAIGVLALILLGVVAASSTS